MLKKFAIFLFFIACFGFFSRVYLLNTSGKYSFGPQRVAHAGGAIEGHTYTNSYEALSKNYSRGFRYFELDFSLTADGHIVCIHDWNESFTELFGAGSKFESCTMPGLARWMRDHPAASIVTDIKSINHFGWTEVDVLGEIFDKLPYSKSRVIPQLYFPENYNAIKEIGYKSIIWTLYRYEGANEEVISWVKELDGNLAVAMPKDRARTALPARLREMDVPTYVHTVNSLRSTAHFLHKRRVSNIYTDHIPPSYIDLTLITNKWRRFQKETLLHRL